ncbi:hypothetical protein G5714_009510 [Onychostoma macrolepis]|uniref:Uncharacterized protein n=1 Tax=Onychostoma macrolepis TaxID=369639 RepID=A0A7J6CSF8_9TELE|nr:hypothetical protein G5714_009510 [Onychostoma macrolepis]
MKLQRRDQTGRVRYQRRRRRGMQTSGHLTLHHLRSEDSSAAATSILQALFGGRFGKFVMEILDGLPQDAPHCCYSDDNTLGTVATSMLLPSGPHSSLYSWRWWYTNMPLCDRPLTKMNSSPARVEILWPKQAENIEMAHLLNKILMSHLQEHEDGLVLHALLHLMLRRHSIYMPVLV